jgi:hypothetical protein
MSTGFGARGSGFAAYRWATEGIFLALGSRVPKPESRIRPEQSK